MDKQLKKVLDSFNKTYDQDIQEKHTYVFKQAVYISTPKAAKFLNVDPHHFSVYYAKEMKDKVHVIHQGKFKWYKLLDMASLMDKSVVNSMTIKELCKVSISIYRKLKSK